MLYIQTESAHKTRNKHTHSNATKGKTILDVEFEFRCNEIEGLIYLWVVFNFHNIHIRNLEEVK